MWEPPESRRQIDGFELRLTCGACPEQYDVFLAGAQVGYLRLRHGEFRADVPDCGGETVYRAEPIGDGQFENEERDRYLTEAVGAIRQSIEQALAKDHPPEGHSHEG